MPRRKVPRELIASRRARATTFARRLEGLKKKADELSVLCGVPVALVCADGEGAAPPVVWESNDALAKYRALPPEAASAHTHRAYADAELGKWVAKLARVRQGGAPALAGWDKALDAADAEEARRVLQDVDAALAAAEERRRDLGLPAFQDDGAGLLEGVAPLSRAALTVAGGSNDFVHVEEYPLHAQGDGGGYVEQQAMWGNASAMQPAGYGFHQYPGGGVDMDDGFQLQMATTMNGHQLQMAAGMNGYTNTTDLVARNAFHQPHNAGCASHCYGGMSGYHTQHVPINNGGLQLNPHNAAVMPVGYPSLDIGPGYMDTPAAHTSQQGYAGNFINNAPPPLSHAMGTGDNFSNAAPAQALAMYHNGGEFVNASGYTTQWPAQQQIQSASSSHQSHSGIEQLHYLSDVEDAQLQLWGN